MRTAKAIVDIKQPEAQIVILQRIQRSVAPMCAVLGSANFRDRARRIYQLAQELEKDIKRSNQG